MFSELAFKPPVLYAWKINATFGYFIFSSSSDDSDLEMMKKKIVKPSLVKRDIKATDLTVKSEQPTVKTEIKKENPDTTTSKNESSSKKPEEIKAEVESETERMIASGFFPPKPCSIVVEKITESQIEKWEEDCSSAPPAPIPVWLKNPPKKPVESKSPSPAPAASSPPGLATNSIFSVSFL